MSTRERFIQENGKASSDMTPCEKQYKQIPYAHIAMERKRDMAAIAGGGVRFPMKMCCSAVVLTIVITVVLMPLLALKTVPIPTKGPGVAWWKSGVIYHVYVRSFYDSDGDGVGDLRGVKERLNYLNTLGVKTIQLSPFYESPMVDFGYDVSNHTQVDPLFGTSADFDDLVKDAHSRGMKIVIDFIPNHTSSKHKWFQQSQLSDPHYAEFYVWANGKMNQDGTHSPPNNWVSRFDVAAWTWHPGRQQYYYHRYDPKMPDLNYRNPAVIAAMQDVLLFWMEKGVDGFRIDAFEGLIESEQFKLDEPRTFWDGLKPLDYHYYEHIYTDAQEGSLKILKAFRSAVKEYEEKSKKEIFLMPEMNCQWRNPDHWFSAYEHGASMPTNKAIFRGLKSNATGFQIHTYVQKVLQLVPFDKGDHWISWIVETHDHHRLVSRLRADMAEVGFALTLLLPGTGITYYGQELGMADLSLTYEQTIDPKGINAGKDRYKMASRDPCRAPMQWSSGKNAGFSIADKTWLPVHPDHIENNVQRQLLDKNSLLNSYRKLVELRKHMTFMFGQHNPMVVNENIYSFARIHRGRFHPRFIVAMNVGSVASIDDYQNTNVTLKIPEDNIQSKINLPPSGIVRYHSANFAPSIVGNTIDITRLELQPGQVIVVEVNS